MMMRWLYIFLIILSLDIYVDFRRAQTLQCIKSNTNVAYMLLFHHIISTFLLYGWLIDIKPVLLFHIFVVFSTVIYWLFNRNLCDITVYINEKCGWKKDTPFKDILETIGFKSLPYWNNFGHYLFIVIGGFISYYKYMH